MNDNQRDAIERNRVRILRDEWDYQKQVNEANWAGLWYAAKDLLEKVDTRDYDDLSVLSEPAQALYDDLINFLALETEEVQKWDLTRKDDKE